MVAEGQVCRKKHHIPEFSEKKSWQEVRVGGTPRSKHLHTRCLRPGPPDVDPEPRIQA